MRSTIDSDVSISESTFSVSFTYTCTYLQLPFLQCRTVERVGGITVPLFALSAAPRYLRQVAQLSPAIVKNKARRAFGLDRYCADTASYSFEALALYR